VGALVPRIENVAPRKKQPTLKRQRLVLDALLDHQKDSDSD